jgi:hypothetical protein
MKSLGGGKNAMLVYERLVSEFMEKYGQSKREDAGPVISPVAMLRMRLMNEELAELVTALELRDRIQIADGLGDFCYVVVGTSLAHGLLLSKPVLTPIPLDIPGCLRTFIKQMGWMSISIHEEDINGVRTAAENLVLTTELAAKYLNMQLEPIFYEVHMSNMTKQVPTEISEGKKYGSDQGKKLVGRGRAFQKPELKTVINS